MPKKRAQRFSSNNDQKENTMIKSRKRKASSPLEGDNGTSWSRDKEQTRQILKDIAGVDFISQNSLDSCESPSENTPAVFCNTDSHSNSASFHLPPVPGAPRILLNSQRDNVTSGSDDSSENSLGTKSTPSAQCATIKTVHILPQQDVLVRRCKRQKIDHSAFDRFSHLSDEIILTIFGWLPKFVLAKCARVCKRWSRLVMDESLWKRIDLSSKTLAPGVLSHVLNRGVWALRLTKTEILGPIFTGLTSPIKSTRLCRVQYLDLSMSGVDTSALEEIFSICRDLRKVSLENLEVSDKVCSHIGENKDLEVLNMAMCQGLTANGLMPILSNCRSLESVHLGWTNLHHHSVVYLCLCLPSSVQRLNISGCRENITDEEVSQLCKTCPDLRELDLSDSTALSCVTVTHICKHLQSLEYLALSRCYHVVPSTLPDLSHLPRLLAFDCYGILREGPLEVLKSNLSNIEVNQFPFSSIARPTTGIRRTSIWGIRVRDNVV